MDGRNECPKCNADVNLEILDEKGAHYKCSCCGYESHDASITDELSEEDEQLIQKWQDEYEIEVVKKRTKEMSAVQEDPKSKTGSIIIFILVIIWILFCLKYCNSNGVPEKGF